MRSLLLCLVCVALWVSRGGAQSLDVIVTIDGVNVSYSQSQMNAILAAQNMTVITYNDQNASLAQQQCPIGSYCPADSTSSIFCPAGTFQPLIGKTLASDCQACPVNTYCPNISTALFTPCPPGFRCSAPNTLTPVACAVGTYQNLANQSTCPTCPAGQFCPAPSTTAPPPCNAGTYRTTTGGSSQADCAACPAGQYCLSGAATPTDCGLGQYQGATGQSACAACPVGQYCALAVTVTPSDCAAGSYRDTPGATAQADCAACPAGYYCLQKTVTPPSCSIGQYQPSLSQSVCLPCPTGHYCYLAATVVPSNCSAGSYRDTPGAGAQVNCLTCPQGQYCPVASTTPANCGTGQYQALPGQSSCSTCPQGSYCSSNATVTPTVCAAGSYRASTGGVTQNDCLPCPAGQYCLAGAINPIDCGVGKYHSATNQSKCLDCPPGFYCPASVTVAPTPCQAGSYLSAANGMSQGNCSTCPQGQFCLEGAANATDCGAGKYQALIGQSACNPCTAGRFCPSATTITPTNCAAGSFRALTSGATQADCAVCTLGTFDATTTARTTDCPLCLAGMYCAAPTSTDACPVHTDSAAGSASQLGCRCLPGYVCTYTKRISATVTLNSTSVADFNANVLNVQTNFRQSIAAAAGVDVSKVTIISVKAHGSTARRRLFADHHGMIDVVTKVDGAVHLKNLASHIRRDLLVDHTWTGAHRVHAS